MAMTSSTLRTASMCLIAVVLAAAIATPAPAAASDLPGIPPNPFPHLVPGDEGPAVVRMQALLQVAGFFNHRIDGVYGDSTASAVVALHKYLRIERSNEFSSIDWHLVRNLPEPDLPIRPDATDYVEVDMDRQVLFVVRDSAVAGILPVSTGGGHIYWSERGQRYARAGTPQGDFTLKWNQSGWNTDPITGWNVYKYWAFTDFYGIHGYLSVPSTPASTGCVRVNVWDADWLEHQLFVGMTVHIWEEPPALTLVEVGGESLAFAFGVPQ